VKNFSPLRITVKIGTEEQAMSYEEALWRIKEAVKTGATELA
jgi:hypothetical protein